MAIYVPVQRLVKEQAGFVPETCWIAHVLELNGCPPRIAHNRINPNTRKRPCPPAKRTAIERALRQLGHLPCQSPKPQTREDVNQAAFRVVNELTKNK